jgi:spermidine synthase
MHFLHQMKINLIIHLLVSITCIPTSTITTFASKNGYDNDKDSEYIEFDIDSDNIEFDIDIDMNIDSDNKVTINLNTDADTDTYFNTDTNADTDTDTDTDTIELREEEFEIGFIQSLKLKNPPLYSKESAYQQIDVYESHHYGKVFVLDECLQLTERDAPNYNEMLAHVPIMEYIGRRRTKGGSTIPSGLNVLVLGGGDGYVVSEVMKHPTVQNIDHCELDQDVISISEQFFPWANNLWNQSNVNLHIEDGAKFVETKSLLATETETKNTKEENTFYNVIIQDSSDPFTMEDDGEMQILPSNVLYSTNHFVNMYNILKKTNGVLIFQAETYNIPSNLIEIRKWKTLLSSIGFKHVRYGTIYTPTYSTGQIGFFIAHAVDDDDDDNDNDNDDSCSENNDNTCSSTGGAGDDDDFLDYNMMKTYFNSINGKTQYYHPQLHKSSYDLPLWVHEYIYSKE